MVSRLWMSRPAVRGSDVTARVAFLVSVVFGVVVALVGAAQHADVVGAQSDVTFAQIGDDIGPGYRALAMSGAGDRVVVGGPAGARVLEWDGSEWSQLGEAIGGGSGVAISDDGATVASAESAARGGDELDGFVRVVRWDGTQWSQLGDDVVFYPLYGRALAVSADGSRIAVGQPSEQRVTVLSWDGNAWLQLGGVIEPDHSEPVWNDSFGEAVAFSGDGDRVAIGGAGNEDGYARVYQQDGNAWAQLGDEIVSQPGMDWFGASVKMSADGSRLAVGAPAVEGFDNAVYVYDWSGSDWTLIGVVVPEETDQFFGISVDLSADGTRLAVKSSGNQILGISGYVRVLDWNGETWSPVTADFDVVTGDAFGGDVALSADGRRVASQSGGVVRVFDAGIVATTTTITSTTGPPTSPTTATTPASTSEPVISSPSAAPASTTAVPPSTLPASGTESRGSVAATCSLLLGIGLVLIARRPATHTAHCQRRDPPGR